MEPLLENAKSIEDERAEARETFELFFIAFNCISVDVNVKIAIILKHHIVQASRHNLYAHLLAELPCGILK